MVLSEMAAILFKTEHHWKTEQKAAIGIPNAFSIPGPTVGASEFWLSFKSNKFSVTWTDEEKLKDCSTF